MSKKFKFLRVIILFLGINNIASAALGNLDTTFDGDGKADQAVFRDGIWHILGSNSGYTATQFGVTTDAPVPTSNNPQ